MTEREQPRPRTASLLMLTYMLDTNICIYVMKTYPPAFARSSTAGRPALHIEHHAWRTALWRREIGPPSREPDGDRAFRCALDVLPFDEQSRGALRPGPGRTGRAGTPCGPHDMQIGGHARSEGLIVVTKNMREFARMPGVRAENWL